MEFDLSLAKIVGTPDGTFWSQVHEFSPPEREKAEKRGRLVIVFSLSEANQGESDSRLGRETLFRINEEYYGNLAGSPFLALRSALEKVGQESRNLQMVAAAFYQGVVYLGILRKGKVVIKRKDVLETILEVNGEGVEMASGEVVVQDLFLLGTEKFFSTIAEGSLRAALSSEDPEGAIEILAPMVAGHQESSSQAAAIVKVAQKALSEEAPPPVADVVPLPRERETEIASSPKIGFSGRLIGAVNSALALAVRRRPVYVESEIKETRRRRLSLSIALILICLLAASTLLGARKREETKKETALLQIYQEIQSKIEEGAAISGIKANQAKELFSQAQGLIQEAKKIDPKNARLKQLEEEIARELAGATREFRLAEIPLFFDLELLVAGARGERLAISDDQLTVLDKEGGKLMGVNIKTKSGKVLAGGEEMEGAVAVSAYGQDAYCLAGKGIFSTKGEGKIVIKKEEQWGQITAMAAYGGNLYLLDASGAVWRYVATALGFGQGRNWLTAAADFSKAVSLAVDGSIWVLQSQSPPILKFSLGAKAPFSLTGLDKPILSPRRIFTDEKTENLYVLDNGNYRVLVLSKTGEYKASYLWAGVADATDLVASEKEKKIFLLSKNKIFEIEIK